MLRWLLWPLLLPLRLLRWLAHGAFLWLRGYNTLELYVHGALKDRTPRHFFAALLGQRRRGPDLLTVLVALDRARRDRRLSVVVVRIGQLSAGLARAQEVAAALDAVAKSGKRVIAYLEHTTLTEYFVALGASEIVLAPPGSLSITGVASEITLLKGLLTKAGLDAQLRARGKYKSMRETFTESEISPANREMTESLVGDLYEQLVERVAAARRLDQEQVIATLDHGPFLASAAQEARLVDRVDYFDQLEESLKNDVAPYRPLKLHAYLGASRHLVRRGRPTAIALFEISGPITNGHSSPGPNGPRSSGAESVVRAARRALDSRAIKGVLLRIDSPGGSAQASELIWRALSKLSEKKPVVVSMANVAASGGYFVAGLRNVPILASPASLTGSIGVVGGKVNAHELYAKLGLSKTVIGRGRRASFYSDYVPFDEDGLRKLDEDIDHSYRSFVDKMAYARNKSYEELHDLAQGRVWTGRQALHSGLVDESGGLLGALGRLRSELDLGPLAPLALLPVSAAEGTRRWPFGWRDGQQWLEGALGLPEDLSETLRLASLFDRERLLALLPFRMRFM